MQLLGLSPGSAGHGPCLIVLELIGVFGLGSNSNSIVPSHLSRVSVILPANLTGKPQVQLAIARGYSAKSKHRSADKAQQVANFAINRYY